MGRVEMDPDMMAKLQEERSHMTAEMRQTVALEKIADLMHSMNGNLVSITYHLGMINRGR